MAYVLLLTGSLFGFWLLLSGFWGNSLLLTLGVVSSLLAAYFGWRIEKSDPRLFSLTMLTRLPPYWVWLIGEIVKSNIMVVKSIWWPRRHPISPTLARVSASQQTPLGRTIFANSITLTPGTVAVEIAPADILVHALIHSAAEQLEEGEMDRRVTAAEGKPIRSETGE